MYHNLTKTLFPTMSTFESTTSLEYVAGESSIEIIKDVNSTPTAYKRIYQKGDPIAAIERRRARNREMAKKSRLKKKQEVSALEQLYSQLVADNEAMKSYLRQFPEELAKLEGPQTTSSSMDESVTPSAVVMLLHDVDLPHVLVELALKMMNSSYCLPLARTSSQHDSTGSLKDLAVQAMNIDSASGLHSGTLNTQVTPLLVVNSMNAEYPIVYVSPAFMTLTGYSVDELVGRNCGSYLQCAGSDPIEIERLHVAITRGQSVCSTLANCRKDQSLFLNEIRVGHYFDKKHKSVQIVVIVKYIKEL